MKKNFLMMAFVSLFVIVALSSCKKDDDDTKSNDVASGTTGACKWNLTGINGNYTLTISGDGAMGDYNGDDVPWIGYTDSITTLVVQEGVTTIGEAAFRDCESLTSITISNSVITIGEEAFENCENLVSVTLGNSVEVINGEAFKYCGLTSIVIPGSITTIGGQAFVGCEFTSVAIPGSVTAIGADAFGRCRNLTAINVDDANSAYSSVEGILFNKDQTVLVAYPGGKNGSYTIPNSVTTIGEDAFSGCTGLTSITIPSSVTAIGESAFYECSGLTEVTCLNPVPPSVDDYAFSGIDNITLKVPANATAAYRAANVWKDLVIDDGNDTGSVIVNNTITANFGSSYDGEIDVVKAELYYESETLNEYGYYDYDYYKVAEAPYNGGFTLQLPTTVSDTYLDILSEDAPKGITISNPNVKVAGVYIYAYKADEKTGSFYYGTSDEDVYGELYYVNGDVSITGTYTENYDGDEYTETWNAHLKRGWNILYEVETGGHVYEYTTKAPVGVKWYYYSYYSRSSAQGVRAKKAPALFGKSSIRVLNKN